MFKLQGSVPGPPIRRRMIEALAYPCMLVVSNLNEDCPQHRYFNPFHPACGNCEEGEECRWLNANTEISALAEKPMDQLYESLVFAIEHVDAKCSRAGHNVRRCACESCSWVRQSGRLAQKRKTKAAR